MVKLVISDIFSSVFPILAWYTSFLTTSFFTTTLSLLKSAGTGNNSSISYLSTLLFRLFKLLGKCFYSSIFNLPTSDFKLARPFFLTKDDVSTPAAFLNLSLLHN